MKRIILILSIALCFCTVAEAQMYVSPNSYVFVNDQFVYVGQDVELNTATSNIYLRNNSQLLQGSALAGLNKGLGSLSVFQEGTSNNFVYNYWCSPVGAPTAAIGNSDFAAATLHRPTGVTTSTPATILGGSPLNGTATNSSLSIASRWLWKYKTSNTYDPGGTGWIYVGNSGTVEPGLGFTMKGVLGSDNTIANPISGVFGDGVLNNAAGTSQRYDFRGLPNDGTITNPVSAGNFTLIGNPYPSAIDLHLFLADPTNIAVINGSAYFWEQASTSHLITDYNGGYGIYNIGTGYTVADFWNYGNYGEYETDLVAVGASYERRFTPIGQGFMVLGTAGGNVSMKNSYRNYTKEGFATNSEFHRTANNNRSAVDSEYFPEIPNVAGIDYTQIKKGYAPQLKIYANYNNQVTRPTTLAFDENATDGFDHGYDGRSASENAPTGFYYILNDRAHEYVACTVKFDLDKRVPVGFRCANETNFKVKVVATLYGFDDTQKVYMHDKVSGIYYDIKNGMFDITLPAGDNKTRFEITFKNFNDIYNNPDNSIDAFQVFQNNNNSMLTIVNSLKKEVKTLSLYDVTGKLILSKVNLGKQEQYEISTSGLSDGIYIVKLTTTDNLSIDKKVSIYKK
jgi:hypothetical protein